MAARARHLRGGSGWDELDGGGVARLLERATRRGLATAPARHRHAAPSAIFYNGSGNDSSTATAALEYQSRAECRDRHDHHRGRADGGRARLLIGSKQRRRQYGGRRHQVASSYSAGTATFTLGTGRDTVSIGDGNAGKLGTVSIVLTDYELGPAADRISILGFMSRNFVGWDHALSPFLTGYARLVQSGADTLLQFDINGGGNSYSTIITFKDRVAASFDPFNLDGYMPDGTIPPGLIEADKPPRSSSARRGDRIEAATRRHRLRGAERRRGSGGPGQNRLYGAPATTRPSGESTTSRRAYGDDRVIRRRRIGLYPATAATICSTAHGAYTVFGRAARSPRRRSKS